MLRFIAVTVLELAANAIGLVIAAVILPGFRMDVLGFVVVVAIFTLVKFVLGPLIAQMAVRYVRALQGGVALVTTFVGLLVTAWLSTGLTIAGIDTWILATLIVWLCGVLAAIVLPLFLFKSVLSGKRELRQAAASAVQQKAAQQAPATPMPQPLASDAVDAQPSKFRPVPDGKATPPAEPPTST